MLPRLPAPPWHRAAVTCPLTAPTPYAPRRARQLALKSSQGPSKGTEDLAQQLIRRREEASRATTSAAGAGGDEAGEWPKREGGGLGGRVLWWVWGRIGWVWGCTPRRLAWWRQAVSNKPLVLD